MLIEEPVGGREIIHRDATTFRIRPALPHELLERSGQPELDAFMEDVMLLDAGIMILDKMENE